MYEFLRNEPNLGTHTEEDNKWNRRSERHAVNCSFAVPKTELQSQEKSPTRVWSELLLDGQKLDFEGQSGYEQVSASIQSHFVLLRTIAWDTLSTALAVRELGRDGQTTFTTWLHAGNL